MRSNYILVRHHLLQADRFLHGMDATSEAYREALKLLIGGIERLEKEPPSQRPFAGEPPSGGKVVPFRGSRSSGSAS